MLIWVLASLEGVIFMMDNLDGFIQSVFITEQSDCVGKNPGCGIGYYTIRLNKDLVGNMYCPKCCADRRMIVSLQYSENYLKEILLQNNIGEDPCIKEIKSKLLLSLWTFKCVQCDTYFTVVFYSGANGTEMAILPSCNGAVVTPNTPPSVAYYLDQAYRAKSIGANSACIAMYRGALEQLMYQQGFQKGMLDNKIKKLEEEILDGTAPQWAKEFGTDYLFYIKKLGNGAIHPNEGDVEKQKELDNQLIEIVDVLFAKLLYKIYEEPNKELERNNIIKEKAKLF